MPGTWVNSFKNPLRVEEAFWVAGRGKEYPSLVGVIRIPSVPTYTKSLEFHGMKFDNYSREFPKTSQKFYTQKFSDHVFEMKKKYEDNTFKAHLEQLK